MNSTKPSQPSSASSACEPCVGEALEAGLGERLEQVVLGGEVAVDGADADPGAAGDLVDLGVEAVLGELGSRADSSTLSRLRRASARWGRGVVVSVAAIVLSAELQTEPRFRIVRRTGTPVPIISTATTTGAA